MGARVLTSEGRYAVGSFTNVREAELTLEAAQMLLAANDMLIQMHQDIIDENGFEPLDGSESTMRLVEENDKLRTDVTDLTAIIETMKSLTLGGYEE